MGSSSTENCCSSSMCSGRLSVTWILVISLLAVAVTVNMMFTGFLLWIMRNGQAGLKMQIEKLQSTSDVLDMQVHHVSGDELNKDVTNVLSENGRERLKRSALSSTQSSQLAVNVGYLFVSAVKQMCKPEGAVCIPGSKGETGEDGRDGLPGLTGQAGTNGVPGRDGRDGQRGLPGLQGNAGNPGSKGSPGKQGPRGMGGMKGKEGEKGEIGHKGERGERGVDGQQGDVGEQGEKGDTGDKGDRGWIGYKGEKGGKGEIGLQGEKGMKGVKGIQGDEGDLSKFLNLSDPCLPWNHRVLNDSWRKTSEHRSKTGYHCDKLGSSRNIHGFNPGWHSFSSSIGGAMPETCPQPYYCGTARGGWLNGSHPVVGQTLSRTVCFSWHSNCCQYETTIEVINCGKYYVYNLPNTPVCYAAYCAHGN